MPDRRRIAAVVTALALGALLVAGCVGRGASPPPASPAAEPWPSTADLGTIQAIIESRAGNLLNSVGQGRGVVDVSLRAGGVELARELVDAYGSAVHVQVGFLEFPSGTRVGTPCAPGWQIVTRTDVRATLELTSPRIVSGDSYRATIKVFAIGSRTVVLDSGQPLVVYLFRPGTMVPVAAYDGAIAGVGISTSVTPSTPATIEAIGSTASCDPTLGYALPPGPYEARALVEDGHPDASGTFWSDALAVEVVAAP